jgi:hypothetical protein
MALLEPSRQLLKFLQRNPVVRARIAAAPNMTLVYAGDFFKPMWKELEQLKRTNSAVASKTLLPEALAAIQTPSQPHATLLAWVKSLDTLLPWSENVFIAWRALSGIFPANAIGSVSFYVGSHITKRDKVFAATELHVLLRNPNISGTARDILEYYDRCVRSGRSAINLGYIA